MTEQIPSTSPTPPQDRGTIPQTRRSDPTTHPGTDRPLRSGRRFGEEALRWPDRSADSLRTSVEDSEPTRPGSPPDDLRSFLEALAEPPGRGWSVPAIRQWRPIPRGPDPRPATEAWARDGG